MTTQFTIDDIKAVQTASNQVGGIDRLIELAKGFALVGIIAASATAAEPEESEPKPARAPRAAKPRAPKVEVKNSGDKRPRASAEEIQQRKDAAMACVQEHIADAWFSLKTVREHLGDVEGRTLTLLVKDGKLESRGERANTKYKVIPA